MLLFLDFDGVLHPDAVYLHKGKIELRSEGELFHPQGVFFHPEVELFHPEGELFHPEGELFIFSP